MKTLLRASVVGLFAAVVSIGLSDPVFGESTPALVGWSGEVEIQTVTGVLGFAFTPNKPVLVTDLGVFDDASDGLAESHGIALWDSSDAELVAIIVPDGTTGSLGDGYRYVPISPVALDAGQTYIIGALYTGGVEQVRNTTTSFTMDAAIDWVEGRINQDATLTVPPVALTRPSVFTVNFKFAPVPEPSTASLMLVATAVSIGRIGRRRISLV